MKHIDRQGSFPSGNPRCYFRRGKGRRIALPDLPTDHPDWIAAYTTALTSESPEKSRVAAGSIAAGVRAYLGSTAYQGLALSTRMNRRAMIEDIAARYGRARMAELEARHIRTDLARLDPIPANNRLKVWRAMCRVWFDLALIDSDPARDVRPRQTPRTDGHRPWTAADVATFRAAWPIGTAQRLAMELIYRTGAAIGDACRLGPGNVKDGWLTYRRAKSASVAVCPWTAPAPDWFAANPEMHDCIAAATLALTFLATKTGTPRSPKAATQWFAAACRKAGLDAGKTAHGLRKYRAAQMLELGATEAQRMAILGHETTAEARHYSASADARRIITGTENSQLHGPNSQTGA